MWFWLKSGLIWYVFILTIVIVAISIGSNKTNTTWFRSLNKPPGMVPDWVFGLAWGILYPAILVAIIYALAMNIKWGDENMNITLALLYTVMLVLTFLWIIAFTNLYMLATSCVIMFMILALVGFLIYFTRKTTVSVVLFSIFAAWICLATYYSVGYAALNPIYG